MTICCWILVALGIWIILGAILETLDKDKNDDTA